MQAARAVPARRPAAAGEYTTVDSPASFASFAMPDTVTDIPREHVLTTAAVASGPASGSGRAVPHQAKVSDVLPMLLEADIAVDVVDDDGVVLGSVDRTRVAALLASPRAGGAVR